MLAAQDLGDVPSLGVQGKMLAESQLGGPPRLREQGRTLAENNVGDIQTLGVPKPGNDIDHVSPRKYQNGVVEDTNELTSSGLGVVGIHGRWQNASEMNVESEDFNLEEEEAIRDAAARDDMHEEEWIGFNKIVDASDVWTETGVKSKNISNYCSHKQVGQSFDDLPKSSKHRLIVQKRFESTNTEETTTQYPKAMSVTMLQSATTVQKSGDTRRKDHREDSRFRTELTYDVADDARECEWKSGDPEERIEKHPHDGTTMCADISGSMTKEFTVEHNHDAEYWRPSCMFHWLKHVGGTVEDAYEYFQHYRGKQSYDELQLQRPEPMTRISEDDGYSDWSHMSDYDEFGMAGKCNGDEFDGGEHCDESGGRMINMYDDSEETPGRPLPAEGISKQHDMKQRAQRISSTNGKDTIHVHCRDDVELKEVLQDQSDNNVELSEKEDGVIGRVWDHVDQTYVANGWKANNMDNQG